MHQSFYFKSISGTLIGVLIACQILFVGSVLMLPKPAEAQLATVVVKNIDEAIYRIAYGIAYRVALNFADTFLQNFLNKVVQKYRIRNFVYYDQVLTDYYLTNYIRDKISDPDLESAFLLLDSTYVTGDTAYADSGVSSAVIPQLKKKINDLYIKAGGIPTDLVDNNPDNLSNTQFYEAAQLWSLNPPSATETNLRAQYGSMRSDSSTAAKLEQLTGAGFKSGRGTSTTNPSTLDYVRAGIDNPGQFVHDFTSTTLSTLMNINYDPSQSLWFQVGSLMGNFLFNKLALNSSTGVLPDGGPVYQTGTPTAPSKEMDLDGDGIIDAYDYDNNGVPDICAIAGVAPNCVGSIEATTAPPEQAPGDALTRHPDQTSLVAQIKADLVSRGVDLTGPCGAFEITKRVAWALRNDQAGLLSKPSGNNCQGYSTDIIIYPDGYNYDILGSGGEANTPQWLAGSLIDPTRYVPAFDPGP